MAIGHVILGDLYKIGITARPKTALVGQVLAWQPKGGFVETVFGPDAPAVVISGGSLAVIGLSGDAALRLAPALAAALGTEVATATFDGPQGTYSWVLDTPSGRARLWTVQSGSVTGNVGVPLPEEFGMAGLGEGECRELIRRRTGVVVQDSDTAIPVDLGPFAKMLEPPDWRETTPQSVQDDIDALVGRSLQVATQLLEQDGQVPLLTCAITSDGEVWVTRTAADVPDPPNAESLWFALRELRDNCRTVAVVDDVLVDGVKALCVTIEHVSGPCMTIYLPYRKSLFGKKYQYGKPVYEQAERRVWA